MAKRVNGIAIESEYVEWGVELGIESGAPVVVKCDDEADARETLGRHFGGRLVTRQVFETSWADAPDG